MRKPGGNEKGPGKCQALVNIGAGEKSRTPDLRITNALLYQLSYTGAGKGEIIWASPHISRNDDCMA